jgi:Leucine-rich repeat (LRR) protein
LAFAGTSALRMLVLSNNPTVKIHKSAFSGLSDVQMIYLPAGIQELENDTFNGLSNVGHLKLQHLNLRELPTFVFRGLRNVQVLTIQESDLGTIRKDVFTNMSNVGRLILQNNKIDMIEELAITPQNRVKSLHMVGNHLLDIPPSSAIRIEGVSERIVR